MKIDLEIGYQNTKFFVVRITPYYINVRLRRSSKSYDMLIIGDLYLHTNNITVNQVSQVQYRNK